MACGRVGGAIRLPGAPSKVFFRIHEIPAARTREPARQRPAVSGPRGLPVAPDGSVLFVQFDTYEREIMVADVGEELQLPARD